MYRSMPSHEFMTRGDRACLDGEFRNLQWTLPLGTYLMKRQLVSTGVALVYHVLANF